MADDPLHPTAEPDVVPLGGGRYRVASGDRQRIAYAAGPPHARWVFLDGRVFLIDASGNAEDQGPGPVDEQTELASPMPATVSTVHVTAGQRVLRGDLLVTLEAMKMEMPVRAPRDGVVTAVHCAPRELVQPGVPLVELL